MHNFSRSPTSISAILLLALLLIHTAGGQTISDTVKRVNGHGDEGYWQEGQPDVMILWPEDDRNFVRRFSGSARHPYPYRLWLAPDRAGGFPVLLKDEPAFNNFLEHINANDDKGWCQLAESWSDWTGNPPSGCGVHSYTQARACSVAADAEKPCPDLCEPAVRTRNRQIDNGPCRPAPPSPSPLPPPPPAACSISAWAPSTGTVCAGERFTQTRTLADCSTGRRTAVGTRSCAQSCTVTAWSPDRSTACIGETLTQIRTLADCSTGRRTVGGTRSCRQTCTATAWSPAASTVCAGETLTQSRTLADCSTDRRTVNGTRTCRQTCAVTAWSPATGTVCAGETLTQSRTLADCSNETRNVSGTRTCAPTCSYSCAMKTTGEFMGTLWIMYRRCSGETYSTPVGAYARAEDCYANLP